MRVLVFVALAVLAGCAVGDDHRDKCVTCPGPVVQQPPQNPPTACPSGQVGTPPNCTTPTSNPFAACELAVQETRPAFNRLEASAALNVETRLNGVADHTGCTWEVESMHPSWLKLVSAQNNPRTVVPTVSGGGEGVVWYILNRNDTGADRCGQIRVRSKVNSVVVSATRCQTGR